LFKTRTIIVPCCHKGSVNIIAQHLWPFRLHYVGKTVTPLRQVEDGVIILYALTFLLHGWKYFAQLSLHFTIIISKMFQCVACCVHFRYIARFNWNSFFSNATHIRFPRLKNTTFLRCFRRESIKLPTFLLS
jgi:hypothetical protein